MKQQAMSNAENKVRKAGPCDCCVHLEYIIEDTSDGWEGPNTGFCCNKRVYASERKEDRHLRLLQSDRYRHTNKVCFEESVNE